MTVDLFERHRVIDVDTHLTEPPDVWTARVSSKWGDAVPHIERVGGEDVWMAGGNRIGKPGTSSMAGFDGVHQGVALKVPPYAYAHPQDLLEKIIDRGEVPLLVALDGVTDPRNLGAIIRSTGAFGGQGLIIPQRRSASVNSAAWKTSAGAAARIPVALAANLTATLKDFKKQGVFVLGLDGDGDVSLPALELADRPVVIVVGSEGKGLSRLVTETCDQVVSIPISTATESLNAGIAASVALYQVSTLRAGR